MRLDTNSSKWRSFVCACNILGVVFFVGSLLCSAIHSVNLDPCSDGDNGLSETFFSSDSKTLIGVGPKLYAWDTRTGKRLWSANPDPSGSGLITRIPDSNSVVTLADAGASSYYSLEFRDILTGRCFQTAVPCYFPAGSWPQSIDVAPNGQTIAVTFPEGILLWKRKSGKSRDTWAPQHISCVSNPSDILSRATFTADSKNLVVFQSRRNISDGESNYWVQLWNLSKQERIRIFGDPARKTDSIDAALSQDRRRLATFTPETAQFALWDVLSGKRLRRAQTTQIAKKSYCYGIAFDTGHNRQSFGTASPTLEDTIAVHITNADSTKPSGSFRWQLSTNWVQKQDEPIDPVIADFAVVSPNGNYAVVTEDLPVDTLANLIDRKTGKVIALRDQP